MDTFEVGDTVEFTKEIGERIDRADVYAVYATAGSKATVVHVDSAAKRAVVDCLWIMGPRLSVDTDSLLLVERPAQMSRVSSR